MKIVHVLGTVQKFAESHNLILKGDTLGVYIPTTRIAYIFLDQIKHHSRIAWLMSRLRGEEFMGHKGMQRFFVRTRCLVELHEYAHHLQNMKGCLINDIAIRVHNEHVADRYAKMKYLKDYGHPVGISLDRRHLSPKEVL